MRNKKKIFFVVYGGGHAKLLLPIIKKLIAQKKFEIVLLALTTAKSFFDENDIKALGFSDFKNLYDCDISSYALDIIKKEDLNDSISHHESLNYHGINFIDLIDQFGKEKAKEIWLNHGRQGFYPINFFKKILRNIKPDLVISTNSPRSEKAALRASKYLNIPSLCLVDLFGVQEIDWLKVNGHGTKICVIDNKVKNFLIENGRNADEIVVTGNPAFDEINTQKNIEAGAKLRNKLDKGNKNTFFIFYASQVEPLSYPTKNKKGDPNLPNKVELELRAYVKKNKNARLFIRYHPSQNCEFTKQTRVYLSLNTENLYQFIHCTDCVIVASSTVGYEAYLANKKLISLNCSIFSDDAPYEKLGFSEGLDNIKELPLILDKYFEKRDSEQKHQTPEKKQSTDKVLKVINSLV